MSGGDARRALPAPRSDFIGLEGKIHLATGGEPPLLQAHRQAFEDFARDKAGGFAGYHRHWEVAEAVRGLLAGMLRLEPGDIALVGNASEGIVKVVSSLDWHQGDNVVVSALDYASGRFALSSLQSLGVELRLVPAEGWRISTDALLAACDGKTRLLYVSQVNATTGQHLDIDALSSALGDGPTALLVDASHALGVVPVRGDLCDFLVSACYKFVLGVHDGVLTWNRRRRPSFEPFGVGWASADAGETPAHYRLKPDARRAEYGNVGHLGAYLLRKSLLYLERYGIDAIAEHVRSLSGRLVEGIAALDLEVMTPRAAPERAGNAAFRHDAPETLVRRAAAQDILVWGDNGRIRASAHLFTSEADVETFLARLPALLA